MTKIFISHSSLDNEFAKQLAQALNNAGFEIWLDVNSINPGTTWNQEIQKGLDSSQVMILILSPEAMKSQTVNAEWLHFYNNKKRLFTVLWKPVENLQFQLESIQYIRFHDTDFEQAFGKLLRELQERKTATAPEVANILFMPPFEWVEIPGGEVTRERGGLFSKAEVAQVGTFYMSKYPITSGQYESFLNRSDGYANAAWWDFNELAKGWRAEHPEPLKRGLFKWDHPRSEVSWCDAMAFCYWLTTQAGTSTYRIRLPSEDQWLRAAVADHGWAYPWGRVFLPGRSNGYEAGRRDTTEVKKYPKGASPYGVMDMVGNVWEWTLTSTSGIDLPGAPNPYRIIRGGSYRNILALPHLHNYMRMFATEPYVGFRIAAVS